MKDMTEECDHSNYRIQYDVEDVQVRLCGDCGETVVGFTRNGITLLETGDALFDLLDKKIEVSPNGS